MIKYIKIPAQLLLVLILSNTVHATVMIGSDLLGPVLEPKLRAYAEQNDIMLGTSFTGTYEAKKQMTTVEDFIALLTVVDENSLMRGEFDYYPIGFQVMSLLVHENNPLDEISFPQISAIFSVNGQADQWGDLVDDASMRSRKIGMGALSYENSLAVEIFKSVIMPRSRLKVGMRYYDTETDMVKSLIDDNSLITLFPSLIERPLIKTLSVSRAEGSQAYSPTIDNIFFGDYPFRLPYYIAVPKENLSPELKQLIKYFFSDEITEVLLENKWIPLPESERIRFRDSIQ